MKPGANYKYMGTLMLIGLTTFQIGDRLMVSWFLLEIMLLVRIIKNNQLLHYQTQKVQYIDVIMVVVKWFGYEDYL
jgi:hypothetical protein